MTKSAFIDTPPASHRDYMIVKSMLLSVGLTDLDPANGVKLPPAKPKDYHFETRGPGIIAGLSVCIAVIASVTLLRLYLRAAVKKLKWGLDDWLMVPGLLMAVAYPSLQIAMVVYGGSGKHLYDVTYEEFYWFKWLANVSSIDFFVGVGIIKMSITAFNIRLTSLSSRRWKIINWTFFAVCFADTLLALFINIFQCKPIGSSFNILILAQRNEVQHCIGVRNMDTILRSINIVLDYCLLAVPICVLWKVQMSRRKKARLFGLLSVGCLACIGSVMTLVSKFHLHEDALWHVTSILGWSLVELTLGVLAASLPTLAFLMPSSRSSQQYPSNINHQYGSRQTPSEASTARTVSYISSQIANEKPVLRDTIGIVNDHDVEMFAAPPSDTYSEDTDTNSSDLTLPRHGQTYGTAVYLGEGFEDKNNQFYETQPHAM